MKRLVLAAVCLALAAGGARAADFSFDPATVRFGYADGYWDHEHRWHAWPNPQEAREFHRRFQDRIYGYRHTRYPNDGWRDDAARGGAEKTGVRAKSSGNDPRS